MQFTLKKGFFFFFLGKELESNVEILDKVLPFYHFSLEKIEMLSSWRKLEFQVSQVLYHFFSFFFFFLCLKQLIGGYQPP
jgi:hypothetical protein